MCVCVWSVTGANCEQCIDGYWGQPVSGGNCTGKATSFCFALPLFVVTEQWGAGLVICLERGADSHMAQLMPLPLTVSCSSKIQIDFTFLVPAHLGSPGKRAVKQVCVLCVVTMCLQCFDAVGWAAGRAHGVSMLKIE